MTLGPPPRRIERIALCNLESLASAPAVNALFAALGPRIGFVIASARYGGKYGGFWRQARRNLARSGWRFTRHLGLQLVWFRPLARLAQPFGGRVLTLAQLARRHGAELLRTREPNAPEVVARLARYAPDVVLSLHFDHVIRRPLIALPRLGVLNVHPSLLPALRGPFPAFWALRLGAEGLGVSVHAIDDETLDTGPVLRQQRLTPAPGESVLALEQRLFGAGARLVLEVLREIEAGAARPVAQPPGAGDYRPYPSRADVAALYARGAVLERWRDLGGLWRR
jgi:methionyl-tRNA formyltransferase